MITEGNPNEVLYHYELGFPKEVRFPKGFTYNLNLKYGAHARKEALQDRYADLSKGLPTSIDIRKGKIIEIGVVGNTITKVVIRFSYNEKIDIIIVFSTHDGFVRTVWANEKNDHHKTLDATKYSKPINRA
jgi:hypothetical protein